MTAGDRIAYLEIRVEGLCEIIEKQNDIIDNLMDLCHNNRLMSENLNKMIDLQDDKINIAMDRVRVLERTCIAEHTQKLIMDEFDLKDPKDYCSTCKYKHLESECLGCITYDQSNNLVALHYEKEEK